MSRTALPPVGAADTETQQTVVHAGDAVLSLLSLGTSSAAVAPPALSPVKSLSPTSLAALEHRMSGSATQPARFQFRILAKENELQSANLPPRESGFKLNISGGKQRQPTRMPSNALPLALALQSTAPPAPVSPNSSAATRRLPISPSKLKSPPRKIVPTHIRDQRPGAAGQLQADPTDRIPSLQELSNDPTTSTHSPVSPVSDGVVAPALSISVTTALSNLDSSLLRSVSVPSPPSCHATPQSLAKYAAYTSHLMRARSGGGSVVVIGGAGCVSSVSNASTQSSSRSSSLVSSQRSSSTGHSSLSLPSRSYSTGSARGIRVCIKPVEQIRIKAVKLLDSARANKQDVRTYVFN